MVTPGPDENTIFLLHGDDIFDSSRYNISVQNIGGVTPSNTKSKFGEKSLYFNGSSYLTVSDIPFPNGTEDFTIEWWQYCETTQSGTCVISRAYEPGEGYGILLGFNQDMLAYIGSKAGSWDVMAAVSMGTRINNAWQHLAVVRNGSLRRKRRRADRIAETDRKVVVGADRDDGLVGYVGEKCKCRGNDDHGDDNRHENSGQCQTLSHLTILPDPPYQRAMLNAQCTMLNARCTMHDAQCSMRVCYI